MGWIAAAACPTAGPARVIARAAINTVMTDSGRKGGSSAGITRERRERLHTPRAVNGTGASRGHS